MVFNTTRIINLHNPTNIQINKNSDLLTLNIAVLTKAAIKIKQI
jgi:hypothetical protein